MEKIMLPKSTEEKIDKNVSKFIIEPLFPGYGATLGNALRRVLLSSVPGSAITSFKIENVAHEFTAIPHVKEDVVEITLNLKNIAIKSHSDEPVNLKISKKGPGIVTADDFSKNASVEILNPEVHIATLDNKAVFDMTVTVETDRGFRPVENSETSSEIGLILVDASFSPIERVKMLIENTRVGKMTNYDKLILEVTSNGSIPPKDAIIMASSLLIEHYKSFAFDQELSEPMTDSYEAPVAAEEEMIAPSEGFDVEVDTSGPLDPKQKIEEAGFSSRTTNALINSGIKTVAGLKRLSDLKLTEIKGLGGKGIEEIKSRLM